MSASRVHACDSISQLFTFIKQWTLFSSSFLLCRLTGRWELKTPDIALPEQLSCSLQLRSPFSVYLSLISSRSFGQRCRCRARTPRLCRVWSDSLCAPRRSSAPACSVRKWHRYAFPKRSTVRSDVPATFIWLFLAERWEGGRRVGGYLLTRFHRTLHSANKQTLRARAALGQIWSPAHRGSDWSPCCSVIMSFTSTSFTDNTNPLTLSLSLSLSLSLARLLSFSPPLSNYAQQIQTLCVQWDDG